MKKLKLLTTVSVFVFVLGACSESSNFNKIFIPSTTKDSFSYYYNQAKLAYDHGNIEKANHYALKAQALFPEDPDNNIILGLTYLDFSGMSALKIIRAIDSENSSKKKETTSTESTSEGIQREDSTSEALEAETQITDSTTKESEKGDFLKFFDTMRETFNLVDNELKKIGDLRSGNEDGTLPLFNGYDVLVPHTVDSIRQHSGNYTVEQLKALKQSICQYIGEDDLKYGSDSDCDPNQNLASNLSTKQKRQLYLLWSFANINEAIVLAAGIFYTVPNQPDFSLLLKSKTLKTIVAQRDDSAAIEYLKYLRNYITDVKDILNIDPTSDSAFVGVVTDIAIAISSLRGVQTEKASKNEKNLLTKMINKLDKVLAAKKDIDKLGGTDNSLKENQAMQNEFLKSANKKICQQINELTFDEEGNELDTISDEKKAELCSEYDKLTGGLKTAIPKICDTVDPETGDYPNKCDNYGVRDNSTKEEPKVYTPIPVTPESLSSELPPSP